LTEGLPLELSREDRTVFRLILVPGAIMILGAVAVCGFSLWDVFHRQFEAPWNPEKAYEGNIVAERRLASCYMIGCPKVPRDPAFGCAWRKIIVGTRTPPSVSDISAEQKACSRLSDSDESWLPKLEADIRFEIREIRERRRESIKPPRLAEPLGGSHLSTSL
jgi:hypothetical protein